MAKNFLAPGETLTITSAGAIASGAGVLNGLFFGVALNAAAGAGETVVLATTGVFSLPKVGSQAWTVGAAVFWTGTACTAVGGSGNVFIGNAVEAVADGAGDTIGKVRLNGAGIRRAAFVANASAGSAAEINALRDALVAAGLMASS
jgi:predicted RecA/RadA family phage recombinase